MKISHQLHWSETLSKSLSSLYCKWRSICHVTRDMSFQTLTSERQSLQSATHKNHLCFTNELIQMSTNTLELLKPLDNIISRPILFFVYLSCNSIITLWIILQKEHRIINTNNLCVLAQWHSSHTIQVNCSLRSQTPGLWNASATGCLWLQDRSTADSGVAGNTQCLWPWPLQQHLKQY